MRILVLAAALAACSIEKNPDVCCDTQSECAALGVDDYRDCPDGQACDPTTFACIASQCAADADCPAASPVCSLGICYVCDADHGCPTTASVCDVAAQTCSACTTDADCANFPASPLCDAGTCVECRAPTDCPTTSPVCDAGACRACTADADCPSLACAQDGTCVDESDAAYVSMTGADTGNCTRAQPCATATYAVGRLAATRTHLVFAAGTYAHCFEIGHDDTNAPSVEIHGGGATFASDCNDGAELLLADVPVIIHDATFDGNSTQSNAIQCGAAHCEAYRLQFAQAGSFSVGAETVLHDVQFANSFTSAIYLQSGSHLTADRVQIAGGDEGIVAGNTGTSSVDISNLLVYGTSGIALDIVFAQGMIRASTIADNGLHMNQAPYSLKCGSNLTVESSILWNRLGNYAPISGTCAFVETIAGPSYDSSSTLDEDPTFVAPVSYDYHLQAGSPAIDQVTIGPDTDLDGVARPQGASYDIGAYEYKP